MNEKIISKMLSEIYNFYPGLAGEVGQTIYSLGDYSPESIDRFKKSLQMYKKILSENSYCNFLVIKHIEDGIYELENTYNSQTYFYYGRGFLTLFESLSTTDDNDCNRQLFIKRLDCLEELVAQAAANLDDELLSRLEILSTRKQFYDICKKIESAAEDLLNQKYFLAKAYFNDLLIQKLEKVKKSIPTIKREQFADFVERMCDCVYSIDVLENEAYNVLEELKGLTYDGQGENVEISQKVLTEKYVIELFDFMKEKFTIPDELLKKIELSSLVMVDSHCKHQTQNYRAIISFKNGKKASLHINTDIVNNEDQLIDTFIHEVFPGHYFMSLFYSDDVSNRIFKEKSFWEGWAFLCEFYSLWIINKPSYGSEISHKLSKELLIGLTCIRIWYHQQSKEEVLNWLQVEMNLEKNVCDSLFLTAILQYDDRIQYFVGFLTMYLFYKNSGFRELSRLVMESGASFYHVNKKIVSIGEYKVEC